MSKRPRNRPPKRPAWMEIPARYPLMDATEYERARRHYNLPANQFAFMIGVGWRQGQRYRDGATVIPQPVAKLIRTALRHGLSKDEIG